MVCSIVEMFISKISSKYNITKTGEVYNKYGNKVPSKMFKNGRIYVYLHGNYDNNKSKHCYVDELVALKYCHRPTYEHNYVIHIDGDNSNNDYKNLKWVTPAEEMFHYYKHHEPEFDIWSVITGSCCPMPGTYTLENAKKYKYVLPVKGFEYKYTVDTYGNVFNLEDNRYLKTDFNVQGYRRTSLRDKTRRIRINIHRIVAITFIPNRYPVTKNSIDHVDMDKLNNHVSNLEWVSVGENAVRYHNIVNKDDYEIDGIKFNTLMDASRYVAEQEKKRGIIKDPRVIRNGIKEIIVGKGYNPLAGRYTIIYRGKVLETEQEKYDRTHYTPVIVDGVVMKNQRECNKYLCSVFGVDPNKDLKSVDTFRRRHKFFLKGKFGESNIYRGKVKFEKYKL